MVLIVISCCAYDATGFVLHTRLLIRDDNIVIICASYKFIPIDARSLSLPILAGARHRFENDAAKNVHTHEILYHF